MANIVYTTVDSPYIEVIQCASPDAVVSALVDKLQVYLPDYDYEDEEINELSVEAIISWLIDNFDAERVDNGIDRLTIVIDEVIAFQG